MKDELIALAKEAMSNADLIERLNAKPNRPTWDVSLGNGQTVKSMGLGHNSEDDTLRKEAADALAAADKRIAEEREQHDIMMERGAEKLAEAERKLSVAREALESVVSWSQLRTIENINAETDIVGECVQIRLTGLKTCVAALAQIGGEDARS